ncbi:galactose oxidase [Rhodoferax aquaticus]|uniref:Galactose oxidase n=1 Tax=Rhodoferax aquaticus TaxID=2527691 RepID=A0A515ER09_9BURK|nr:galactose oxidase [Rhodoferax aquaticus]QDL55097.1 galactose oxidase [Rhodoferax aquaticus]
MNTPLVANPSQSPTDCLSFKWRELPAIPPNQRCWSPAIPVGAPEWHQIGLGGAISGVHNDWLLVGGGANFPEPGLTVTRPNNLGKVYWDEAFALNLTSNVWSAKPMKLPKALAYAATISLPEGVLVLGGEGFESANGSLCEKVQPSADVCLMRFDGHLETLSFQDYPSLPYAMSSPSACLLGRSVFLQNGQDVYSLNLDSIAEGWSRLGTCPGDARSAALTSGVGDRFLIASGRSLKPDADVILRDAYAYEPKTRAWTVLPDMPLGAMAGMAFAVQGRFFVVVGGDGNEARAREYRRLDAERKLAQEGSAGWVHANTAMTFLHDHHTGFNQQIQVFDGLTGTWSQCGFLPSAAPVTSQPVQWRDELLLVSGEVSPGKRTPKIWAGKPQLCSK